MKRILIAEDDMVSRKFLFKFLSKYGECDLTVDGLEALDAFLLSLKEKKYYDLICLDIMMPKIDGVKVLKTIRDMEKENKIPPEARSRVIMTTALGETAYVQQAFDIGCEAYASKPIDIEKFVKVLEKLGLILQEA
jgi:two-component system, chemotaxis family, chemotaxis protein CheY